MKYDIKDKHFIRKANGGVSPCIQGNDKWNLLPFTGSVLPNCVGFATGAFNIWAGQSDCKYLGNKNAKEFTSFASAQGLFYGQKPKPGACMVWGGTGDGHVAIVEEVIDDNTVRTSESGWNYMTEPIVRYLTRKKGSDGRWGYSQPFLMFIYQPGGQPEPVDQYYVIKRGDTLTKIAKMFGVTVKQLVEWNNIKNPDRIYAGERLIIKQPAYIYHIVVRGDTLTKIAREYNTSIAKILELNPTIKNPNLILVGQRIRIK